jgi:putative PIN family toxin of toxin-antitoxin system
MEYIVLGTNCLLMSLPRISPYRLIWDSFNSGKFTLCVTTEILEEYMEIISSKASPAVANNVISTILNAGNTLLITPYYRFNLIKEDLDDNKFVDCCISSNASYIVTNDHHFDVLRTIDFPCVNIIRIKEFCSILTKSHNS